MLKSIKLVVILLASTLVTACGGLHYGGLDYVGSEGATHRANMLRSHAATANVQAQQARFNNCMAAYRYAVGANRLCQ